MGEFIQGIKNLVAIVLLGGALLAVIVIWGGLAPVYDALSSSNMTWSSSGNITDYKTSEAIAQNWKYLMFFIPFGGVIAIMIFVARRRSGD